MFSKSVTDKPDQCPPPEGNANGGFGQTPTRNGACCSRLCTTGDFKRGTCESGLVDAVVGVDATACALIAGVVDRAMDDAVAFELSVFCCALALKPLSVMRQAMRKKNRALGMGQQDTLAVHLWRSVNYEIVWR